MPYQVHIIHVGYSKATEDISESNCTCTVVKGKYNVIIDTLTPWDREVILNGLKSLSLACEDIHFVVSTHGHSDHTGNNHLFLNAKHIVGHCISFGHSYFNEPFSKGEAFEIDGEDLKIIPTPGHTLSDVTVLVKTINGLVAITGDLFECKEDLNDENIWLNVGSESPEQQRENRKKILSIANFIIPGHGDMFTVFDDMKT